jgi:hypothetical protein
MPPRGTSLARSQLTKGILQSFCFLKNKKKRSTAHNILSARRGEVRKKKLIINFPRQINKEEEDEEEKDDDDEKKWGDNKERNASTSFSFSSDSP